MRCKNYNVLRDEKDLREDTNLILDNILTFTGRLKKFMGKPDLRIAGLPRSLIVTEFIF